MVANGSERGANKKSWNVTETERGKFLVYFTTRMTRLIHDRDVQCQRQGIDNREKLCERAWDNKNGQQNCFNLVRFSFPLADHTSGGNQVFSSPSMS